MARVHRDGCPAATKIPSFGEILQMPTVKKMVVEDHLGRIAKAEQFAQPFTPQSKPLTRRQRIWYTIRNAVVDARMRLGSWIAGVDIEDRW